MRRSLVGIASVLVLLPAPSRAQQPDTARAPSDTVFPVAPLVVTASRLPLPAERLGFAITAVEPAASATAYAIDALREVPGSFVDESVGPGGPVIVRLRGGEEVFTQVLMDGVQMNQNGGFFDFQGMALSNLDRIEVARGPQSAVYGSSAMSGVVHFLTPRGHAGRPVFTFRGEGGGATEEGGNWRATGSVRGGTERLRYSAGAGAAYSRGIYALPHDTESRDGSLRLDWAPSSAVEAVLTARRIEVSSLLPVRDPGATRVPLDPNAFDERDRTVGALTLRLTPSDAASHYVRIATYREDFVFEDEFDGVTLPPDAGFFVFDANLRFTSALRRTTAEAGGNVAAGDVRAAYGVQWEKEELEDRITGDFGGDPVILDRTAFAGFGEVAWRPDDALTVGTGVRLEKYEDIDLEATPRASLQWAPPGGVVALRAVVGRAYKAPNLQQQYTDNPFIVANPDIRPERSTSIEVGADLADPGGSWAWGAGIFQQDYEDLIRTVGREGDDRQINRNLGEARATGLEWYARARLSGPWAIGTDGSWIDTEILENSGLNPTEFPVGEALPFRPSVVGSLWLGYEGEGPLSGRVTARRLGSQTVLSERFSGRRVALDAYTLVGVTGAWEVRPGTRLYVRVENLFDTAYETAFDRRGIPATGALGVEVRF